MHNWIKIVVCSEERSVRVAIFVKVKPMPISNIVEIDSNVFVAVVRWLHVIKAECVEKFMHDRSSAQTTSRQGDSLIIKIGLSPNMRTATISFDNLDINPFVFVVFLLKFYTRCTFNTSHPIENFIFFFFVWKWKNETPFVFFLSSLNLFKTYCNHRPTQTGTAPSLCHLS